MVKKFFSGFTLVELMIVLAFLAVLIAIVIVFFTGQIAKGTDAQRKSDMNRIKLALEEYEKDHNCYPPKDLVTCNVAPLNGTGLRPYLEKIPCDPATGSSYDYEPQE